MLTRLFVSAAAAAGVNLLLLGALLALNGTPPPGGPDPSKPASFRAVRLDPPARSVESRPAPLPPKTISDVPRLGENAAGKAPLLTDTPPTPGVRALDFVPAPGISALGVVPFGIKSSLGEASGSSGRIGTGVGDGIGTVGIGELDRAPREVSAPLPPYPSTARRAGIEGLVETRLLLSEEGVVERVEIVSWEGHSSFPETVRRGLLSWRFTPAFRNGHAIRIWKPFVVRFKLDD